MGCRKCGGKSTRTISPSSGLVAANSEMVSIEYIGQQQQKRRLRSKVNVREQYVFSGDQRRFLAYKGDVDWLTSMASEFKLVDETSTVVTEQGIEDVPVLNSAAKPLPSVDMPIDVLILDPITLAMLKKHFNTVSELRNVGRSGWMLIKGIGASRADSIAEALNAI